MMGELLNHVSSLESWVNLEIMDELLNYWCTFELWVKF